MFDHDRCLGLVAREYPAKVFERHIAGDLDPGRGVLG
jgi:hypothetical protein